MAGPNRTSPDVSPATSDTTPGYPEPQPTDKDDARHRGPHPGKDPEDGGLDRDTDGGSASDDG